MKGLKNCWGSIYICLLLLNSCILHKNQFTAKPLKNINEKTISSINGVYAGFAEDSNSKIKSVCFYVFYQNGVVLSYNPVGSYDLTPDSIETVVRRKFSYNKVFDVGGYKVVDSNIIIQLYRKVPGFAYDLFSYNAKLYSNGNIYVSTCKTKDRKDWCNDEYELKRFPIEKPDSTNRLFSKRWYWTK
jgi:hypothetical protein